MADTTRTPGQRTTLTRRPAALTARGRRAGSARSGAGTVRQKAELPDWIRSPHLLESLGGDLGDK